MKNLVRNGVIGLIVAAAVSGGLPPLPAAFGQPGGQPEDRRHVVLGVEAAARQPNDSRSEWGPTISVNFAGVTLEQDIRALQEAAGDAPVNVVTPVVAKRVELPPISLRGVSTYTALDAVRAAFEENSEHQFNVRQVGMSYDATFALAYVRIDLRGRPQPTPGASASGPKRLEVYSIRDLIEPAMEGGAAASKVAYEDILAAVEAALKLLEVDEAPRMMFHKETGLLMVGGTPEQTGVVDTLIKRIREDMQRRWGEERSGRKASAERARRLTMMRNELKLGELEVAQAAERLKRTEQRVEGGLESKDMLSQANFEYERAKANLERRQLDAQAIEEEMERTDAKEVVVYDLADILKATPDARQRLHSLLGEVGPLVSWRDDRMVVQGTPAEQQMVKEAVEALRKSAPKAGGK